jgi:hypothetical protein
MATDALCQRYVATDRHRFPDQESRHALPRSLGLTVLLDHAMADAGSPMPRAEMKQKRIV